MSIFTCCEREDETKYIHPCDCPSASFTCVSEQITPTLCGFSEFEGNGIVASVPPDKYLIKNSTKNYNETQVCREGGGNPCSATKLRITGSLSRTRAYDVNCGYDDGSGSFFTTQFYSCSYDPCSSELVDTQQTFDAVDDSTADTITSTTSRNRNYSSTGPYYNATLSSLDTEANATARETPVDGTWCSSLWSTRDTGFSWVKRTSGYTIECDDLVVGVEYEVKPAIRKRTAVIGSFGAWEDVTVTPVTFTATATTKNN